MLITYVALVVNQTVTHIFDEKNTSKDEENT